MHLSLRKLGNVFSTYADRLAAFHPNARLYLLSAVLTGASIGVFRLLFNFFVLSLGYDDALLGTLVATSSMTVLLCAVPMGYLADLLGRKSALLIGGAVTGLAVICMAAWPSVPIFYVMSVIMGAGQSLSSVTMGPFLMENSDEKERTYLFSFASGLQTGSAFIGNWIGGNLPTWLNGLIHAAPTSSTAYGFSLLTIGVTALIGTLPMTLMHMKRLSSGQRSAFAPFSYFRGHPVLLGKLVLPMLVTSIGAGMIMPFMNVFFRETYGLSDPVIGTMFAWGSLAMGIGLLIAPPLADRFGKIQIVVITQGLSIPFLVILGFSPVYFYSAMAYYIRLTLMNMTGPIYQTFVMERVEESARATVASLVSMASNFGWAFSPSISGWLQVTYGFGPAFLCTIVLYTLSVSLYWSFFWRSNPAKVPTPLQTQA
ncbi:MAG TPA: MFS transporter [Longilinea sp.]|nr:MFS transporter [Longilinea sp.]